MTKAYVITGEGARGSFQAGVLKKLSELYQPPDRLYGISSGSANAFLYAYAGPGENARLWSNVKSITDFFTPNWLSFWYRPGLMRDKPLQKMIDKYINAPAPFKICFATCDTRSGKLQYWYNDQTKNIRDQLRGSVAIAGLIEPVNDYMIDGGSLELNPISKAIEDGHDEIHVIAARRLEINKFEKYKGRLAFTKNWFRALDMTMHLMMTDDIDHIKRINPRNIRVYYYQPRKYLFDQIRFSMCPIGVEAGYRDHEVIRIL